MMTPEEFCNSKKMSYKDIINDFKLIATYHTDNYKQCPHCKTSHINMHTFLSDDSWVYTQYCRSCSKLLVTFVVDKMGSTAPNTVKVYDN